MNPSYPRIAIITGTTSGIGEATARAFLEDGFGVLGNGRNEKKIRELEQEFGNAFRGVVGDAAEEQVIDSLFPAAEEHFGRPADIVVANAGRGLGGTVTTVDMEEFREVLNI
ncbi:MAG: SDR family oxidoreductase, partial [Bacteroidota bacterium]